MAPGPPPKLEGSVKRPLEEDIGGRPGATHEQRGEFLLAACGVEVSEATICRAINKPLSHGRKRRGQEPARGASGPQWRGVACSVGSTAAELGVRGRDGHPHLAGSFVWL